MFKTPVFGIKTRKGLKFVLSIGDPSSPFSVYLDRHWCHPQDKMDQAFPSVSAYSKQSKLVGGKAWERGYRNAAKMQSIILGKLVSMLESTDKNDSVVGSIFFVEATST